MTEKELVTKMIDTLIKSRKELANIDLGITKKSLPDLDKIIEHLNAPLMIMVMGEFSTGKSTFINAMVGEEVAAVNATPTTAVITKLCYGNQDKILVHYTDGTEKEFEKEAFKQLTAKTGKVDEDKAHEAIEYVERQMPLDMLQYVTIIDSPGLNDINEKHSDTTKKFVNNADTVFWMFNALHAGSKTEVDAMETLTPRLKPIAIINMMDEIDEEEDDPQEFLDNLRVQLKDKVQAVVGISAKYALEGKLEKNEKKAEIGNLKELEQVVRDLVLPNRDKFKLNTLMDELGEWFSYIDFEELEAINQKNKEIDYEEYLNIKTKIQSSKEILGKIIFGDFKEYVIAVSRIFNEQAMALLGELYYDGITVLKDKNQAEQYYEAAAIKNHVFAQASMGAIYWEKKDIVKAKYWLEKASAQNNRLALLALSLIYLTDLKTGEIDTHSGDLEYALPFLEKAAELDDSTALLILSALYFEGIAVNKDTEKATDFLLRSAELGNETALLRAGEVFVRLFDENDDKDDIIKALDCFTQAAEYGESEAFFNLGEIYRKYWTGDDRRQKMLANYKKAALLGNDEAQNMLGKCYEEGWGVDKDGVKAIEWYKKAAEQGNITGQMNLGNSYFDGILCEQDYKQAFIWYKKAAEQGNAEAQYFVACFYYNGWSVEKNHQQAFEWYKKAAEQSNVYAQGALAACYLQGIGTEKNEQQAFKWYSLTAEQGVAKDQHSLALLFFKGVGTPKNEEQALSWFKKSAEQGNVNAQADLAYCYENGCGTAVDIDEALNWYKRAAEQGDEDAKNKIAELESYKNKSISNYKNESYFDKCKREAEKGDAGAQYELGVCYATGNEVARNDYQAFRWYEKAANKGNAQAQYALANFYAQGRAVTQSTYTALIWYNKAAAQGYKKAELEIERLENSKATFTGGNYRKEVPTEKDSNSVKQPQAAFGVRKAMGQNQKVANLHKAATLPKDTNKQQKDNHSVFESCKRAADSGDKRAQYDLALLYMEGTEIGKDDALAVYWCRTSAEQGYALAQYTLATYYLKGIGTDKNLPNAKYWFEKAAAQGYAKAELELQRLGYAENTSKQNIQNDNDNNNAYVKPIEEDKNKFIKWGIGAAVICVLGIFLLSGNNSSTTKTSSRGETKVASTTTKTTTGKSTNASISTTPKKAVTHEITGVIIGTDVNARTSASMQSNVIGSFDYGEKVTVILEQGEWVKVRRANGAEYYVARRYLGTQEDYERKTSNALNIPAGVSMTVYHSSADQEGSYSHSGMLAVDGSVATCWSEGVKGLGIGENIEIQFNDIYKVNGMNIWIGHQKTQELFYQNARPTVIRVLGSDGSDEVYTLRDTFGGQRVNFKYPIKVNKIKIVVVQAAQGSKYEDTCIAEINFF